MRSATMYVVRVVSATETDRFLFFCIITGTYCIIIYWLLSIYKPTQMRLD